MGARSQSQVEKDTPEDPHEAPASAFIVRLAAMRMLRVGHVGARSGQDGQDADPLLCGARGRQLF